MPLNDSSQDESPFSWLFVLQLICCCGRKVSKPFRFYKAKPPENRSQPLFLLLITDNQNFGVFPKFPLILDNQRFINTLLILYELIRSGRMRAYERHFLLPDHYAVEMTDIDFRKAVEAPALVDLQRPADKTAFVDNLLGEQFFLRTDDVVSGVENIGLPLDLAFERGLRLGKAGHLCIEPRNLFVQLDRKSVV